MVRRAAPAWLLPVTVIALGALMVTSARLQRARVEAHLEQRVTEHVASVARVLFESTEQTAEAIDLAYLMLEARLHASLLRLSASPAPDRARVATEDGLSLWRLRDEASESGRGERLDAEQLARAWSEPAERLFELEDTSGRSVACLVDLHYGVRGLVCVDGKELSELRASAGPGHLFARIVKPPLRYVVLQDEHGILAASPGATELEVFEEDPGAPEGGVEGEGLVIRTRPGVREGVRRFRLPDGGDALLRVGLDTSLDEQIFADLAARHRGLVVGVVIAVLLSLLGAWLLVRRAKDQASVEAALEAARAENEHWRTIGLLAATVAHEVRNPLNAIHMSAQRLAREFEVKEADREEFQTLVGLLKSEGARVDQVVSEFLELGRPLNLQRRPVRSSAVLQRALAPLEARAKAEGKHLVHTERCEAEVSVDDRRIVQLVDNLVRNALDALPAGGTVTVTSTCDAEGLEVLVEDDGAGIEPETLAKVMDPFFTTKARGTGLGLPLARRLARAHGGSLRLDSTPGEGTRARLFIPQETSQETP